MPTTMTIEATAEALQSIEATAEATATVTAEALQSIEATAEAAATVTAEALQTVEATAEAAATVTAEALQTVEATVEATGVQKFFSEIGDAFYQNFIAEDRWKYLTDGLANTLLITLFALLLGLLLGFLIAMIRATHDKTGKLKVLNFFAKIYLTVIRGTPVVVQLLIIYFVIFGSVNIDKMFVAVLAFGLNSGAYVAEIVRSGIMSIDNGQFEAGASLGFGYSQTMISIILPQAFKNVLPALANEFIVLLKETSVAGYIAIADLTKGGDIIRSQTYEAFLPLLAVAVIYLVMVMFLTHLVGKLERRLAKNDKR